MGSQRVAVIHVVEDDESVSRGLARLLRISGYDVKTYKTAEEFILAKDTDAPGCVLMDVHMPGLSGLDLQESLASRSLATPVVFLSADDDISTRRRAMEAGAIDFLYKPVTSEALLAATKKAIARDQANRAMREQAQNWRDSREDLTVREREVFDAVVAGKPNREIALELGITERTIQAHRMRIMKKIQAGPPPQRTLALEQNSEIESASLDEAWKAASAA